MKTLSILVGKPASGKSTWAKRQENNLTKHLEMDLVCIVNPIYFTFKDSITGEINKYIDTYDKLILDFLFYTNKDIENILKLVGNKFDKIEIHYWNEDVAQCLINDKIRQKKENRECDCSYTITNKRLEYPNIEILNKYNKNIKIIEHEVYR
jgi:dephospho-CoA kinase